MELGKKAADILTKEFEAPIKLEFEKVYYPYLLLAKKRYAGNLYTRPDRPDKKDCKGVESVRRDNCELVRTVVDKTINILLNEKNVKTAQEYVKGVIYDLKNGNVDLSDLIISRAISKELEFVQNTDPSKSSKSKKPPTNVYKVRLPHVTLAEKLYKRDPKNPPMIGDRIPYVILKGAKNSKLYEQAEDPLYALERDLPIDINYYIEKQVKPPISRIFKAISKDLNLFEGDHSNTYKEQVISKSQGMGLFFGKAKQKCLSCKNEIVNSKTHTSKAICEKCKSNEVNVYAKKNLEQKRLENEFFNLWTECQRCQGSLLQKVICFNQDCPIFFRRFKARKDGFQILKEINNF
jgi:DNA polymerase delta subunit 1